MIRQNVKRFSVERSVHKTKGGRDSSLDTDQVSCSLSFLFSRRPIYSIVDKDMAVQSLVDVEGVANEQRSGRLSILPRRS